MCCISFISFCLQVYKSNIVCVPRLAKKHSSPNCNRRAMIGIHQPDPDNSAERELFFPSSQNLNNKALKYVQLQAEKVMSPLECFVQFNLEKFSNLTFVCLSVRESHDLTRVSRWTLESRLTSKFPTRRKMTNTNIGKYCAAGNKTSSQPPQLFIHIYRCTS